MTNSSLICALSVAILMVNATGSVAQGGAGGKMGHGPRHSFSDLDTNGDGGITREEMKGHARARFDAADTDGDGALSQSEMIARMQARMERRTSRMIERHDADGDGKLGFDEMRMRSGNRMFGRLDADSDGTVTQAEFEAMRGGYHGRHGMKGRYGDHGQHGKHDWNNQGSEAAQ